MNTTSSPSNPPVSRTAVLALPLSLSILFAACATDTTSRRVSAPPPDAPPATTTTTQVVVPPDQAGARIATTASSSPTIIVQQAPPAIRQESMPERPTSNHVWVAGYWAWANDQYYWVPGHWAVPPRAGANWIPPRWERDGGAYRFYDGYWAD